MGIIGLVSGSRLFLDCVGRFLGAADVGEVRTWPSMDKAMSEWRASGGQAEALIVEWPEDAAEIELPIRRLKRDHPDCALILLVNAPDLGRLAMAFGWGADGVLSTRAGCAPLTHALGLVLAGEKVFPSELAGMIGALCERERPLAITARALSALDRRERAVAARVADGMANKTIASDLGVSEAVVKSVVKAILRKLRLRNRTQLAVSVHNAGRTAADPRGTGSRVAS